MGRPTANRAARFDIAPAFVMASCGPVSLTLPWKGRTGVRHMHASGARAACVNHRGRQRSVRSPFDEVARGERAVDYLADDGAEGVVVVAGVAP